MSNKPFASIQHLTKSLLIFITMLPLISTAQIQYRISGDIKGLKTNEKIFLILDYVPLDSSVVKNGKFEFNGNINHTKIAALGIYEKESQINGYPRPLKNYREFYLSVTPVTLKGTELETATIEGGALNAIYSKYWFESDSLRTLAMKLNTDYMERIKNGTLTDEAANNHQERFQEFIKTQSNFDISFLENNEVSIFSADLIERHLDQYSVLQLEKYFDSIPFTASDSLKRKNIINAIARYKKLAIGSQAPSFVLLNTDGKEISLESFKGKTILLDFWASWCIPCRKENPRYLTIYEKFKNKNFEIVAISLNKENEKEAWLKAIHDDKIADWKHLSDLKGNQSPIYKNYAIRGLPQNYLLDENGIIIGQNLKGNELEDKLNQILK